MTGSGLIVVLLPVRNGGPYVRAAVESVLSQTYQNHVVLVIDDGSTDGTATELTRIRDARVHLASGPGAGIVAVLNLGLDLIDERWPEAEFVARMDADDLALPDRFQRQVELMHRSPGAVACGTDYELFGQLTGVVRMPRGPRAARARLVFGTPIAHPTALIRLSVLRKYRLRYDPSLEVAEDHALFSDLSRLGDLRNVGQVGLRYRTHPDQASERHAARQRRAHLTVASRHLPDQLRSQAERQLADWLWPDLAAQHPVRQIVRRAPGFLLFAIRAAGWWGLLFVLDRLRGQLGGLVRRGGVSSRAATPEPVSPTPLAPSSLPVPEFAPTGSVPPVLAGRATATIDSERERDRVRRPSSNPRHPRLWPARGRAARSPRS